MSHHLECPLLNSILLLLLVIIIIIIIVIIVVIIIIIVVTIIIKKNYDCSDEGLTLETSAFLPSTVANLRFQPSC